MKRLALLLAAGIACALTGPAAAKTHLGLFDRQADIGHPPVAGSARYVSKTGTYLVKAGGRDLWAGSDDFHFVATKGSGDMTIAATVAWVDQGGHPYRKAGVMMRQSLDADSPYADLVVHWNGHVALQYRAVKGGPTYEIEAVHQGPGRFQLERQGDYVYMSVVGPDGVLRHAGGGYPVHFDGPYFIGIMACAHSDTEARTATFSDVRIAHTVPLPAPTAASHVESTLETITVDTLFRQTVYTTTDHIEAPNWTRDNRLIFNSDGHLFGVPVAGGAPARIDTGPLHALNNDHGLSADGQWLAVSDQTSDDRQSRVYVLPASGGQPRQVTPQGPSYWHGWSPDGETLTVIGNRGGDFDVYAVPAAGGPETRLTTAPGLDDGAEYSPDGQWIYFNSVRSGNMKIWRMHPDGSGQEQVTTGADSRDWFPHVSPDGKWIAFVSFGTDVAVGDHPPNRDVMLKLMSTSGGEPIVLTRLFGGQGTMNVPSWSPDSTRIAFVSYRQVQ